MPLKILLVDDDVDLRQSIEAFFEQRGHQVTTVADGLKALLYLDESVDVLISDIQMPGLSGIDLLRTTRERFPDLPVILMTAHGTFDTAVAALRHRAYDYLQKPIRMGELAEAVGRLRAGGK